MSTTRSVTEPVPGAAVTSASRRLKHVCCLVAGGTPSVDDPANWSEGDDGVPWAVIGDMSGTDFVGSTTRRVSSLGIAAKNLPLSTLQTVLFAMYASVGAVARPKIQLSWNQAILGLEPFTDAADSRFLSYWLRALKPRLSEFLRSNTQDNLNAESVGNLPFPAHVPGHQRAIADFLDAETARIDALIAKKRRMISLLAEQRMSIYMAGVEGSLDDAEPRMKSEVPWLSDRPQHWKDAKLTLVARLGSGHTPSRSHPEWWQDCVVPWITTGEVAQLRSDRVEHLSVTRENISHLGLANSSATVHPAGTVVLSRTASAGYSAIMGQDMATSQDFVTWTCGPQLRPGFLLLCLRAMRRDLLERLAQGSTHQTIYMPDVESIRIPLPATAEQDRIVEEVWRRLGPLGLAEDLLDRQSDLLQEHRRALITAAVTGKIDIPVAA